MKRRKLLIRKKLIILLLVLLALAGCGEAGAIATSTSLPIAMSTSTLTRTKTVLPSSTETSSIPHSTNSARHTEYYSNLTEVSYNRTLTALAPTLTPSQTPTITKTAFPPPTRQNTLEPLPTLSDFAAQQLVMDLLENNNSCEFPCFWGITPGETEWREAFQFLDTFDVGISENEYAIIEGNQTKKYNSIGFFFQIPYEEHPSTIDIKAINGIVEYIEVLYLKNYSIQKIMQDNGIPEEIWVRNKDNYSWTLVLYYPSKGFLSSNLGFAPDIVDKSYHLCFDGIFCRVLEIWSNEEILTIDGKYKPDSFPDNPFVLLEDISNFSVESFYEVFLNAEKVCIDFPFDEWPEWYLTPTPTP